MLDMQVLAGVDSDQVEARIAATRPGSGKAVRGFETGVITREEKPGLSV